MKITLLSILFTISTAVFSQLIPNLGGQRAGISAMTFLKMDVSPRSTAMGGASNCLAGDAYSAFTNVATMAEVKDFSIGLSNTFWAAGINHAALGLVKPTKLGNFGLAMSYLSSGAMPVRTEFQPDGTGEYFYASSYSIGVNYAKQLTDAFSYGATLKVVEEQLAQMNTTTPTIDLGFLYRTDYKDLSFAVNIQNFGFNSKLKGAWTIDSLFYNKPANIDNYPPPTVFQLGISMIPYKTESQSLTVAVQLNHPNDNAENIRLGAEYAYKSLLFARVGYKINVKDEPYPTLGMGLRMRMGKHPLRLDYAFEPTRYLGMMHKIGLSLAINKAVRE